jgi:hypothetical protein
MAMLLLHRVLILEIPEERVLKSFYAFVYACVTAR